MKNNRFVGRVISMSVVMLLLMASAASAYWIWTPETKKFVNPKHAVKDSPKEQFDYAMKFYQAKDYQKAAAEFEKLTKQYEYSEYASKAQYYVGLSYENMNKLYIAFQNYQKAIDNFPHIENIDEIIAREFNIANIFATKASPKVLGTDILTSTDRAVEIYKKVAENAPFGKLAEESQFRTGSALKKADRFDEAVEAFQKILDDYPNSQFYEKAKFEVADCAYKASLKPAYDIESTDKAIKAFEEFAQGNRDKVLTEEASKTIQRLRDKSAEKSLMTAKFYEDQRHYESAIIYYKDVITRFPDSSFVKTSKAKIEELEKKINKSSQKAAMGEAGKKSWMPFNLPKKAKPVKTVVIKEKAKSQGRDWLSFMKPKKKEASLKVEEPVVKVGESTAKMEEPAKQEPIKESPAQTAPVVTGQEGVAAVTEAKVEEPTTKEAIQEEPKPAAQAPKTEKSKGWWNPISFTSKPKAKMEEQKKEKPTAAKKGWSPLSFSKSAEKKEPKAKAVESAQVLKTEKSKGWWNPLNFTNKPTAKKAETPIVKKKGWSPLSFTKTVKKEDPAKVEEPVKAEEPVVKEAQTEAPAQATQAAEVSSETKTEKPAEEEYIPAYKEY
ncbi:MAG: tetratricopeptide repeat protein [Candidatus Omnitrophota bacterium]|jgi:outer membrane assembly lipoprotein YfiO